MTDHITLQHAEEIRSLIAERLGVNAADLQVASRKAGRLLPRWARGDLRDLALAEQQAQHPKLHKQINDVKVARTYENLREYLQGVDPSQRRISRILSLLGAISFNLLVVTAAVICILVWRGFL